MLIQYLYGSNIYEGIFYLAMLFLAFASLLLFKNETNYPHIIGESDIHFSPLEFAGSTYTKVASDSPEMQDIIGVIRSLDTGEICGGVKCHPMEIMSLFKKQDEAGLYYIAQIHCHYTARYSTGRYSSEVRIVHYYNLLFLSLMDMREVGRRNLVMNKRQPLNPQYPFKSAEGYPFKIQENFSVYLMERTDQDVPSEDRHIGAGEEDLDEFSSIMPEQVQNFISSIAESFPYSCYEYIKGNLTMGKKGFCISTPNTDKINRITDMTALGEELTLFYYHHRNTKPSCHDHIF